MNTVYAGTTLNLTCGYTLSPSVDTTAQTAVTWMVDGVAVDTSPGRISPDEATLSFSPIATSDTGNYMCTLTVTALQTHVTVQGPPQSAIEGINVEGSHSTPSILSIHCSLLLSKALPNPEVMISQEYSTVTAGDSHTVQCTVTNIPYLVVPPTVELIGPGNSVLVTDMDFTVTHNLDPVMTSHAGQYTCRASIKIASVSVNVSSHSDSTLIVQSKSATIQLTFVCLLNSMIVLSHN